MKDGDRLCHAGGGWLKGEGLLRSIIMSFINMKFSRGAKMIAAFQPKKYSEGFNQASDLEKALECESMKKMLRGRAGAFSSRYWFINEYTNYVNLHISDTSIGSSATLHERSINLKNIYNTIKNVAQFAEVIFSKKDHDPVDVLFISRNRRVKIKTESGCLEGDYIFYSVISELQRINPDLVLAMYLIDNDYSKYRYATPLDLLRSGRWALEIILLWAWHGKEVIEYLQQHGCGYASQFCVSYFHFRSLFRNALLGYSIKNLFANHRPMVTVSNDDCMYTKPQTDRDFKTIVLQSASVVEAIEDCRALTFRDKKLQPDFFLCSGRKSGEIKAKVGSAKKVVVTGQPRYDVFFHLNELYCKKDFKERCGIKPGQKTILWATQTHGLSHEENLMNLQAILGALQSLEGVILIIKQHPAETEDDTELIKKILGRYNVNAVITPKDSDTYEQLFFCDLMITRHSTTALEAVAMGKPVIILNLSGKSDLVDYVREKVAAGVYEEKDLRKTIERLLKDDSELAENRNAYLDWILYKIDGKATERVVDMVVQMIGSKEGIYE